MSYEPIYKDFTPDQLKAEAARLEEILKERREILKDAKGEAKAKAFIEKVIAARGAKLAVVKSLIPADKADTKTKS